MPIKICQHCGTNFFSKRSETKFCNRSCYEVLHAKCREIIQCLECNVPLKGEQNKFCSRSCSAKYNNKIRSPESRNSQKLSIRETLKANGKIRTEPKLIYRKECSFKFNIYLYRNIPGYDLLINRGIYHPTKNPSGVCRDHILSVNEGYKLGIKSEIISHPANCQFLSNSDNCKKGTTSWISVNELHDRIKSWDDLE